MPIWQSLTRALRRSADSTLGLLWRLTPYGQPPRRGTPALMRAYREHPWFRAATNKIATAVARTPWRLYQGRGPARRELDTHPFLELWERPNPFMSGRTVRQLTQVMLDLKGECFWVLERNALGLPVQLYPIPPHWMVQVPSANQPWFQGAHGLWQARVPMEDVLWFRDPNPEDPFGRGVGIGEALADELDTDEFAARRTKAYFYNQAAPDIIVSVEDITEEQRARLKQEWIDQHQGFQNAFRAYWAGAKMSVTRLDTSLRDMDYIPLRKFERDAIIQTFGIPPEMLGIIEHSNRSTIDAAQTIFASELLLPRLEFMQDEVNLLVRQFGADLSCEYDNPVPADREFALRAMATVPQAFTGNELRSLAGFGAREGLDELLPPLKPGTVPGGSKALTDDPPWALALDRSRSPAERKD